MEALDTEKPSDLSEQECKALIEVDVYKRQD